MVSSAVPSTPGSSPLPPALPPDATARALGWAGLIPFVAGAIGLTLAQPGWHALVGVALIAYAALIASFLGGIHWGLVMRGVPETRNSLIWGVMPSLLGWIALLLSLAPGLAVAGLVLAFCYGIDRRLYRESGLDAWLSLRLRLTVVATLSCWIAAWGAWSAMY